MFLLLIITWMQALCDLQCPPYALVGSPWLCTAVYHSYSQISASSGPRDLTRFSQLSMQLSYWEKKSIISFWSFIKSAKQIKKRRCQLFDLKYRIITWKQNYMSQKLTYTNMFLVDKLISFNLLWNHFYQWGSMFVVSQNFPGS